ncbi:MAG: ABC transporter ATP-binding protein [bacterium]|nr:ABC transporter ATP-binding protein [bacterium]
MSKPVILAENISKQYQLGEMEPYVALRDVIAKSLNPKKWFTNKESHRETFWALKDINFSIEKGEVIGLIGSNGAGKSTLLKVLSRITSPTTGKITLRGRVASLLEVGTGFHPELTGRENVFLNGAVLGMTKREISKKFDEIVEFAEVEKFLDTPVKRYSSGMRVRLAFAVAAHLEPEILLVDEVLAVGDTQFQKKCLGKMDEVTKEDGRTIIFVSHNMGAIQSLCKSCVVLNQGKIVTIADTDKAVQEYLRLTNSQESGTGPFDTKIKNFTIEQIRLSQMQYSKPLITELLVTNNTDKELNNIRVGIQIFNSQLARIMTVTAKIDAIPKGKHKLEISAEDTNLPPGNYSISLGLGLLDTGIFYRPQLLFFEMQPTSVIDPFIVSRRDVLGSCPPTDYKITQLS